MILSIIITLLGIIGGFSLGRYSEYLRNSRKKKKEIDSIWKLVEYNKPPLFVFPVCTIQYYEEKRIIEFESDLIKEWENFIKSDTKIMIISGTYGMGKTYLARQLISNIAAQTNLYKKEVLPFFINSFQIESNNISQEILKQINESLDIELDYLSLRQSFIKYKSIVVFDALDQLPYMAGEYNRIDAILDFVEQYSIRSDFYGKFVLVVREEFIAFTSDFDNLIDNRKIPKLQVCGFPTENLIKGFLDLSVKSQLHWEKLSELIKKDHEMLNLFSRPITLARYSAIDKERVALMSSTGTTISEVFRLSFANLTEKYLHQMEQLAYAMFKKDRFTLHLRSASLESGIPPIEDARELATKTGILLLDHKLCQFGHASWRDFFVAMKYMRSIREGHPKFLGIRQNTYLVSEFVAGLLDEPSFINLLCLSKEKINIDARINIIDILSELENPDLKRLAKEHVENEIYKVSSSGMNEFKTGLYTNAGILGFEKPIDDLISYVKSVGIKAFLQDYFPTKNDFSYYGHSQDQCENEWINVILKNKYEATRRLMAFLLGEMQSTKAISALRIVRDNKENDLSLREEAAIAIRKITGMVDDDKI